jgi:hypothetical protein
MHQMVDCRPFGYPGRRPREGHPMAHGMDKRITIVVEGHRMLLLVLRRQGTNMCMSESDTP